MKKAHQNKDWEFPKFVKKDSAFLEKKSQHEKIIIAINDSSANKFKI